LSINYILKLQIDNEVSDGLNDIYLQDECIYRMSGQLWISNGTDMISSGYRSSELNLFQASWK
jgi:hypothetical protein